MTRISQLKRAAKLKEAAELLNQVNILQQEALGDYETDLCFDFHNELEDLIDRFEEMAEEISVDKVAA